MKLTSIVYEFLAALFFISCASEIKQPETIDGVWKSVGYGRVVKINNGNYNIADVTSISCIPLMDGKITEFGDALQLKNDTLSLKDGINMYYFTRIEDDPAICKMDSIEGKEAIEKADDPEYNFEVLWKNFEDHYAYFELRKVNPKNIYDKYRPMVSQETSEVELFMILSKMLNEFNDGHIYIEASSEIENAAQKLKQQQIFEEPTISEVNNKEKLKKHKIFKAVADKYIPNGKSIKGGNLRWGIIDENVGYLQVNQMLGVAETNLSDTLSYYEYMTSYFGLIDKLGLETSEEQVGMNNALDKIMLDFKNTAAVIIDLRFNSGGKDEVGMDILKRFNSKEKLVFTKKGKLSTDFTPTIKVMQPAVREIYQNPVYLLISVKSASATEIMVLGSLSMQNITTIGSNTEGVFSDVLDKKLPNGWEFGLSSEVYEDLSGTNYEGVGIAPDFEIGYSRDTQIFLRKVKTDLEGAGDASIKKALEIIKKN